MTRPTNDSCDGSTSSEQDTAFLVKFDWTEQDELQSLAIITRVLFNPAKQIDRMIAMLGGVAAILFTLKLVLAQDAPLEALMSGMVFIPGLAAVILLIYRLSKGKRTGENISHMTELIKQRGLPDSMIGPMQATLAPSGITIINRDYSRASYDWSAISDITVEDGYLMLHALWMVYVRIPDHAFQSPGERDAAITACENWVAARSARAEP